MKDDRKDKGFTKDNNKYVKPDREVKGNTLEFYNDDMSRKAVGKLFRDEIKQDEKPRNDEKNLKEGFVVNMIEKEVELDETDYEPSNMPHGNQSRGFEEGDYNFSLYRKKRNEDNFEPVTSNVKGERSRQHVKEILIDDFADEFVNVNEKEDASEYSYEQRQSRKQKPTEGYQQERKRRPEADEIDFMEEERIVKTHKKHEPKRISLNRKVEPKAKGSRQPVTKVAEAVEPERKIKYPSQKSYDYNDDYDDYSEEKLPLKFMVIAAVVFIAVLLMAGFVFAFVSTKNQLEVSNKKLESYVGLEKQIADLKLQNETLTKDNADLKNQGAKLEDAEGESPISAVENGQEPTTTNTTTNTSTNTASAPKPSSTPKPNVANGGNEEQIQGGNQTYTVQKGDNLGEISKQYYGTEAEYEKIMEANNLDDTDISPGQKLVIPE